MSEQYWKAQGFSSRVCNALDRDWDSTWKRQIEPVRDMDDLRTLTDADLLRRPGLGKLALAEIRRLVPRPSFPRVDSRGRLRLIRHILDVPVHKLDDMEYLRACVVNARTQAECALRDEPMSDGERSFILEDEDG